MRLQGVTKEYGARVAARVLHGIDLALERGTFSALMGPSGSGKSTLLNLIGLLDRPTSGTITVDGVDTGRLDEDGLTRLRGRKLGFIFQFHHLLPAFTALENVMMPVLAGGARPTAEVRNRALWLLEQVGMAAKASAQATDLSGGQQQRVAVARALMYNPPLILADEPTGNLDTESAAQVFDLLRLLTQQEGATVLVVTHDPRLAARCDRTITIVDGRIQDPEAASQIGRRPA